MTTVSIEVRDYLWEHFELAWEGLHGRGNAHQIFEDILQRMSADWRGYHDLTHLVQMLKGLRTYPEKVTNRAEMIYAILTHDWIGKPGEVNAELRSAYDAALELANAGVPTQVIDRVHDLIMVTDHKREPKDHDQKLMVDLDLSIFAANDEKFALYEAGIWKEWSPIAARATYTERRAKFLKENFLDKEFIYHTEHYRKHFEARARMNLARLISVLEKG